MTWGLPQHEFPILTPGQMNPFNQAMAQGLDTYQNMQKAAYQPKIWEAEIGSKNAYSQNVGRQMAATILGNPLAVTKLTPEQFNGLLSQLTTTSESNLQKKPASTSPLGHLWDNVKSGLGMGGNPPTSQLAAPPSMGSPAATADRGMSFNPDGTNKVATEQDVDNAVNRAMSGQNASQAEVPRRTTPAESGPTPQEINDSYLAKNFPYTPEGIAAQARLKKAETEAGTSAKAGGEAYQKYLTSRTENSTAAIRSSENNDSFLAAYNKAWAKGPWTKTEPGKFISSFDPDAVESVNASNNLVLASTPILLGEGGKKTDYGRQLVENSKINLGMAPDTVKHIHDKQNLIFSRIAEETSFINEAAKYGITDVNKIRSDFYDYNNKYRLVNGKGKLQPQSIGKYAEFYKNKFGKNGSQNSGDLVYDHKLRKLVYER